MVCSEKTRICEQAICIYDPVLKHAWRAGSKHPPAEPVALGRGTPQRGWLLVMPPGNSDLPQGFPGTPCPPLRHRPPTYLQTRPALSASPAGKARVLSAGCWDGVLWPARPSTPAEDCWIGQTLRVSPAGPGELLSIISHMTPVASLSATRIIPSGVTHREG